MWEALQLEFMRQAVVASVLISILCGILGSYVVVNRISFISGGIAHAAYGGVGLSLFLGIPILLGTSIFSLCIGILVGYLSFKERARADTIIGVLWAAGMAVGIFFLEFTPGYKGDVLSYLFGNILLVSRDDNIALLILVVLISSIVVYYFKEFMAISFDRDFSIVIGIPAKRLYILLICLIALGIVATIKIIGLLLVVALFTIPPYIAERFVNTLGKIMVLSGLLTILFCVAGLHISFRLNLPAGATIIAVSVIGFLLSKLIR